MSAVVRRRAFELDAAWWLAAAALALAFSLLAMVPLGAVASNVSHWFAYLLITGQIRAWEAVALILSVLPWWLPRTGLLISVLYGWAQFVIAFGWEGLTVAVAAISWTGIGALVLVLVGGALLG